MSSDIVELEVKLIERIMERRKEIISEAEKKANETINKARGKMREILTEGRETQLRIAGTRLRAVRYKILGEAESEGRRKVMAMRQEMISRVFDEVRNRLKAIAEGKDESLNYQDILVKLISEAASAVGDRKLIIAVNKRDRQFLQEELEKIELKISGILGYDVKLNIDDEPIDCLGGITLYDSLKKKVFYNTLDGRLQKARSGIAAEMATVLGVI